MLAVTKSFFYFGYYGRFSLPLSLCLVLDPRLTVRRVHSPNNSSMCTIIQISNRAKERKKADENFKIMSIHHAWYFFILLLSAEIKQLWTVLLWFGRGLLQSHWPIHRKKTKKRIEIFIFMNCEMENYIVCKMANIKKNNRNQLIKECLIVSEFYVIWLF